LFDIIQLALMKLLPKRVVSRLAGSFARSSISKALVPWFARQYVIDHTQAEFPLEHYSSLTDFFIRKLKPGLRPIAEGDQVISSPVDGVVSQFGIIKECNLIQAKGINYSILELLGQDQARAESFNGGVFLTIYLSPQDYHRIHAPVSGNVTASTYVPGTLFPVNPFGVRAVKGLFARNERLVTYLNSTIGSVAVVKVGAIIVGSVKVNYAAAGTNIAGGKMETKEYPKGFELMKGEELGRFEFGSTVILLFQPGRVCLEVEAGQKVLMGQRIGFSTN
jgi:phosphatidylserine decarboxylase